MGPKLAKILMNVLLRAEATHMAQISMGRYSHRAHKKESAGSFFQEKALVITP